MPWVVEILNALVEREIRALPDDMQARFLRLAELIEESGPIAVGMPHIRPLGGKLYEMRLKGRAGIARAIFVTASGQRLVVLHAFVKKSRKTPPRALAVARQRMEDIDNG